MDGNGRPDPVSPAFSETHDEAEDVLAGGVPFGTLEGDVDPATIAFEPGERPTHLVRSWEPAEVNHRVDVRIADSRSSSRRHLDTA
jgi:hypothetical protein